MTTIGPRPRPTQPPIGIDQPVPPLLNQQQIDAGFTPPLGGSPVLPGGENVIPADAPPPVKPPRVEEEIDPDREGTNLPPIPNVIGGDDAPSPPVPKPQPPPEPNNADPAIWDIIGGVGNPRV